MIFDINKIIDRVHNYIYANDGLSNYEVLNELLKIFYVKSYDETHDNLISDINSENDLINKVKDIYKELTNKFPSLFDEDKDIYLKDETLIYVIKELKSTVFTDLSSDIKGHLMQRIIDRSFREGRGQFFTPPQVVDFVVKMINPKSNQRGCDPACGTGGFMFAALNSMATKGKDVNKIIDNIDFYDISKSIVKLVKMRIMFEYSIDDQNIILQDSLSADIPSVYDFVLTNPPFGSQGRISDKSVLSKYMLGHDDKGKLYSSQVPDVLFVEKVLSILKEGGKCAIVLPDGNFENPTSKYLRDFIIRNSRIDAIVSLPDGTFIPYGTGVKSSILFLTKCANPSKNYDVFFGQINNLGYSFSKHSKSLYDKAGAVIEDYSRVVYAYKSKKYDIDNFTVNIKQIIKNNTNLSYHFYSPRINETIKELVGKSHIRLHDLISIETKKHKIDPDKTYKYVEISDINSIGCEIINCSTKLGSDLPSRASYIINENQIIVAIAGSSIGSLRNAKAIVTKEYDGCICTNGLIVINAKQCSPYLLLHFFNSEAFRVQVRKYRYGTAIPTISHEDFLNIIIPEYSNQVKSNIISNMKKAFALKIEANKLLSLE